jgi:hypothetical protein
MDEGLYNKLMGQKYRDDTLNMPLDKRLPNAKPAAPEPNPFAKLAAPKG